MLLNRCSLVLLCSNMRFCNSCQTIRITCLTSKWHKVNLSAQQYRTKQAFTYYSICHVQSARDNSQTLRPLFSVYYQFICCFNTFWHQQKKYRSRKITHFPFQCYITNTTRYYCYRKTTFMLLVAVITVAHLFPAA